ncbi:DUF983 domain-containing protein [Rubrolithibacter danxiaensis]|uniref:DUF983 domain-containing protein n=1 Tax=Rubrolithibacter danxiaensis TaxID=3390805 RepID=UPI003BF7D75E
MAKSSEFSAFLKAKCPRCRRGNMFSNSMYGLKPQKMNDTCPHCGLRYEREPGYFYVSMFISYGLSVAEIVAVGVLTYFITGNSEDPYLYIIVTLIAIILLAPVNYRYSRVILLYWLTPGLHYQPDMDKEKIV